MFIILRVIIKSFLICFYRIISSFFRHMNLDQKAWFTSVYKQLSSIGIDGKTEMPDLVPPIEDKTELYSEVRRECAYNFPAMVIFVGPSNFVETLYPTFAGLAADPMAKVRKTLASSLHELANRVESSFNTTKVQIVRLFNGKKICAQSQASHNFNIRSPSI